jgi:hypothetical protein
MYYLKAESEEALFEALENAGVTQRHYDMEDPSNVRPADLDPEEAWTPTGEYDSLPVAGVDLDVIGTIFVPSGVMLTDEEGNLYPEMLPAEGYHANIRGITPEQAELLPTIDAPANPVRKWAGD